MAMLKWENKELSEASGVSTDAVYKIKMGISTPQQRILAKLRNALEAEGIEFTDHDGVRRKTPEIEIFEGSDRFEDFYSYMYSYLDAHGGDVCLSAVNEKLFREYRKDFDYHCKRMKELVETSKITFRVLATKSYFTSQWAQYKWQPEQSASPIAFYVFGENFALISFAHKNPPYVVLHKSSPFAEAYRRSFDMAWANTRPPLPEEIG